MTAYSATAIHNAIRSLLEGAIGAVRVTTPGMFVYGTFDGQAAAATRARALDVTAVHRFDVKLGAHRMHGATPISAKSSTKISTVPVTIDVTTKFKAATLQTDRDAQRALAADDCQLALQALEYPGNLSQDASANPTGIVSGMLMGDDGKGHPAWEVVEEDWKQLYLRSRISGTVVVAVTQPVNT